MDNYLNNKILVIAKKLFENLQCYLCTNRLVIYKQLGLVLGLPLILAYLSYTVFGICSNTQEYDYRRYWSGVVGMGVFLVTLSITFTTQLIRPMNAACDALNCSGKTKKF